MKRIIILIIAFLIAGCNKINSVESIDKIYIEEGIRKFDKRIEAPAFSLKSLLGNDTTLADYKGKVVFLNFWASWCPPCVKEMPSIEKLYKKTVDKDIEIIAINIGERLDVAKGFMDNGGFNFQVLLDKSNFVANSYSVRSIPSTFIIDKEGYIVAFKIGAHEWDNDGVVKILENLVREGLNDN